MILGVLAGLVSVTGGAHAYSVSTSLLIGGFGGVVALVVDRLLVRYHIDDVVAAFAVHGAAGIWGILAVGLLGNLAGLPSTC